MPYLARKSTKQLYTMLLKCNWLRDVPALLLPKPGTMSAGAGKSLGGKKEQEEPEPERQDHLLWRGGGIVFGPHPRDFSYSIPKKVRKKAVISALSMKLKQDKMLILKDFPMEKISTRIFKSVVDLFDLKKALFVLADDDITLQKSSRNIKSIKMIRSEGINVYDILNHEHLVLLEPSIKKLEGALLK